MPDTEKMELHGRQEVYSLGAWHQGDMITGMGLGIRNQDWLEFQKKTKQNKTVAQKF